MLRSLIGIAELSRQGPGLVLVERSVKEVSKKA